MMAKLFVYLVSSILGILFSVSHSWYLVGILILLLLFVFLRDQTRDCIITALFFIFFYITTLPTPLYSPNFFEGTITIEQEHETYQILKTNDYRFLTYDLLPFEVGSEVMIRGDCKQLDEGSVPLISSFSETLKYQRVEQILSIYEYCLIHKGVNYRGKIRDFLLQGLHEESQQMVALLFLGQKTNDQELYEQLIELNVISLFVISGLHFQLLASVLHHLLHKIPGSKGIILIFLFGYLWLLGFPIPAMRAFLCFAYPKKRQTESASILILSAFFQLRMEPYSLFQLSFQLTYLVSFILLFLPKFKHCSWFFTPLFIGLGVIPLLLSFSYEINLGMTLFQILLTPVVLVMYLASSLVSVIHALDVIYYPLVASLKALITLLSEYTTMVVMGKPTIFFHLLYYGFFFTSLYHYEQVPHLFQKRLFAIFLLLFLQAEHRYFLPLTSISFINVGQGDCILLSGPYHEYNILIDTGGSLYTDYATKRIIPYLKALGVHRLDALILTHDDFDHIGASESLIEHFPVGQVIEGWKQSTINVGSLSLQNLNQYRGEMSDDNSKSAVLYTEIMNQKLLLMGDAPLDVEHAILAERPNLKADIIKIGHHGSDTSSGLEFLDAIDPSLAVIMVGKNNRYGHPHHEVLTTLQQLKIDYYRTDIDGSIVIQTQFAWLFWPG